MYSSLSTHLCSPLSDLQWSSDEMRYEMNDHLREARILESHPPQSPSGDDDALTRTCEERRQRGDVTHMQHDHSSLMMTDAEPIPSLIRSDLDCLIILRASGNQNLFDELKSTQSNLSSQCKRTCPAN